MSPVWRWPAPTSARSYSSPIRMTTAARAHWPRLRSIRRPARSRPPMALRSYPPQQRPLTTIRPGSRSIRAVASSMSPTPAPTSPARRSWATTWQPGPSTRTARWGRKAPGHDLDHQSARWPRHRPGGLGWRPVPLCRQQRHPERCGRGFQSRGRRARRAQLAGSPYAVGNVANTLVVDSTQQFLFTPFYNDGTIGVYLIGVGGIPAPITGSPFGGLLAAPYARGCQSQRSVHLCHRYADSARHGAGHRHAVLV